eukprot:scaffold279030_cov19-Tisochrysis_lutea.AAC.1
MLKSASLGPQAALFRASLHECSNVFANPTHVPSLPNAPSLGSSASHDSPHLRLLFASGCARLFPCLGMHGYLRAGKIAQQRKSAGTAVHRCYVLCTTVHRVIARACLTGAFLPFRMVSLAYALHSKTTLRKGWLRPQEAACSTISSARLKFFLCLFILAAAESVFRAPTGAAPAVRYALAWWFMLTSVKLLCQRRDAFT